MFCFPKKGKKIIKREKNIPKKEKKRLERVLELVIYVANHVKGLKKGAPLITQGNGALGEDPPRPIPTWGLK